MGGLGGGGRSCSPSVWGVLLVGGALRVLTCPQFSNLILAWGLATRVKTFQALYFSRSDVRCAQCQESCRSTAAKRGPGGALWRRRGARSRGCSSMGTSWWAPTWRHSDASFFEKRVCFTQHWSGLPLIPLQTKLSSGYEGGGFFKNIRWILC